MPNSKEPRVLVGLFGLGLVGNNERPQLLGHIFHSFERERIAGSVKFAVEDGISRNAESARGGSVCLGIRL